MREKSNMELQIQQKMEQFRIDPDPADWQAIHDRLHKKKRRRFIWWILPISGVLLLGGGAYFVSLEESNNETMAKESIEKNNVVIAPSATDTTDLSDENIQTTQPGSASSIAPAAVLHSNTQVPKNNVLSTGSLNKHPFEVGSKHSDYKANQSLPTSETTKPANEHLFTLEQVSIDRHRSIPAIENRIPTQSAMIPEPQDELPAATSKSIPNTNTHKSKGWYLGAYGGIGMHNPSDPISFAKTMDMQPNTGSSGSNYYYQGASYVNNGFHYNAGLIVQKKNKNFDLSFGLGIQHNNWSEGYTLYKDSILATGSLYNTTILASKASTYKFFALEIPIMTGFRFAGKNNSAYWFNLGLNNAITLSFKEHKDPLNTTPVYSGGSTGDISLTSLSNIYQPQLRFGLTYERTSHKYHWQVSPYMQYGLKTVMQKGDPDVQMLNLGLQFRYFFKRLR